MVESFFYKLSTSVGINVKETLRISSFKLIGQLGMAVAVDGRDSDDASLWWRVLRYVHPVDGLSRQGNVIVLIQHFYKYLGKIQENSQMS